MKGIITNINPNRGMVAVKTEDGSYSIFEMSSDTNFNLNDQVSWMEDEPYGDCRITNHTEGEEAEVYFQEHNVLQENLSVRLLF